MCPVRVVFPVSAKPQTTANEVANLTEIWLFLVCFARSFSRNFTVSSLGSDVAVASVGFHFTVSFCFLWKNPTFAPQPGNSKKHFLFFTRDCVLFFVFSLKTTRKGRWTYLYLLFGFRYAALEHGDKNKGKRVTFPVLTVCIFNICVSECASDCGGGR